MFSVVQNKFFKLFRKEDLISYKTPFRIYVVPFSLPLKVPTMKNRDPNPIMMTLRHGKTLVALRV